MAPPSSSSSSASSSSSLVSPTCPVSSEQIKLAVNALYAHLAQRSSSSSSSSPSPSDKKKKAQLLSDDDGEEDSVYAVFTLLKVPPQRPSPFLLPLPHSLFSSAAFPNSPPSLCIITKDPPSGHPTEYSSRLSDYPVPGLSLVLPLSQLRSDYHQYKDKRALLKRFDLFLADERVLPMLPPLLGTKFFQAKKQPVPVRLSEQEGKRDWRRAIGAVLSSALLFIPRGASITVKVSKVAFSRRESCENVAAALEAAGSKIPGGWGNISAVYLKTDRSASLPVYMRLPKRTSEMGIEEIVEKEKKDIAAGLIGPKEKKPRKEGGGDRDKRKREENDDDEKRPATAKKNGIKEEKEEEKTKEGPKQKKAKADATPSSSSQSAAPTKKEVKEEKKEKGATVPPSASKQKEQAKEKKAPSPPTPAAAAENGNAKKQKKSLPPAPPSDSDDDEEESEMSGGNSDEEEDGEEEEEERERETKRKAPLPKTPVKSSVKVQQREAATSVKKGNREEKDKEKEEKNKTRPMSASAKKAKN